MVFVLKGIPNLSHTHKNIGTRQRRPTRLQAPPRKRFCAPAPRRRGGTPVVHSRSPPRRSSSPTAPLSVPIGESGTQGVRQRLPASLEHSEPDRGYRRVWNTASQTEPFLSLALKAYHVYITSVGNKVGF